MSAATERARFLLSQRMLDMPHEAGYLADVLSECREAMRQLLAEMPAPRADGSIPVPSPEADRAALSAIREVLARVLTDECADRQYALEAIERIAGGGEL